MRNKLIREMFVILIITVLAVAASVYAIMYVMSHNAMMDDIRERADGVRDYILATLSVEDVRAIGDTDEEGAMARLRINEILSQLRGVGNIKHLYILHVDSNGGLHSSLEHTSESGGAHFPSGRLAEDMEKSMRERVQVPGDRIYRTDYGNVYSVYWPVLDSNHDLIGVVGMEFDVDDVYTSYRRMAIYSLALSGALIVLFSIIAFLSMSKATEPFYKKLAYTDPLTGYENRMGFEHRLRDCEALIERNRSVTLIIFDVNNLKTVNDTYGHKHGDLYLKGTADILKHYIDASGILYRIGGDEFATILTSSSKDDIQRILDGVCNEKKMLLKNVPFSCACGAATFDKNIDASLRELYNRADARMYEEKKRQKGVVDQ